MVVYTDGSMLEGLKASTEIHTYHNKHSQDKSWNLGDEMEVFDAELFAIEQVLHLAKTKARQHQFLHLWIFADNQAAIRYIHKPTQHKTINILTLDSHCHIKPLY